MAYNNKIIRRLHQEQFSPLDWLERMENAQQSCCFSPTEPLPVELDATATGLQSALERLHASIRLERVLLFPLLRAAGEGAILTRLTSHRQLIARLTVELLQDLRGLRGQSSLIMQLGAASPAVAEPGARLAHWDAVLQRVPELSRRLIRYLQLAETDYLPMADYLLGNEAWPRVSPRPGTRAAHAAFSGSAASSS